MMKMERPRVSLESEARSGKEAVDHWCLEPACQSGPGAAAYPVLLPPVPRGARGAECLPATPPAMRLLLVGLFERRRADVCATAWARHHGSTPPPEANTAPVVIW